MNMPAFARPLSLGQAPGRLLAVLLALTAGLGFAAQTPADDQRLASLQADCRLEGQAAELAGTDLDQFIEECVADLLSVEIHNLQRD